MSNKTTVFTSSNRTTNMEKEHPFQTFLTSFIPLLAKKSKQHNQAAWILETTGSADAAALKADLDAECRILLSSPETYQQLLAWERDPFDPILKRQLNVLIRAFKQNQIEKSLLEEMAQKEAALAQAYASFRPELEGKPLSENEVREILKKEKDPVKRKKAWEASKEIGAVLAPQILALVSLRNQVAKSLGYSDYFQMQLELQEVDAKWLHRIFDELDHKSEKAYEQMLHGVEKKLSERFAIPISDLGPWAWSDPFCQEDPLDSKEFDALVQGIDLSQVSADFYRRMGIDVLPTLARSDMEERPGKNQHAFCTHIDRMGDVRTLNNVKPTLKWLEVVLHELGHAIYELGFDEKLPWLLREPPHMITTEAMALIAGRQAYRSAPLHRLTGKNPPKSIDESLKRRQLIFSRWVLVMTAFESALYRDPTQDLNRLWWECVEKYQKISPPKGREGKCDWATKYHIGLAPVYYFSYLLGELFASAIQETLARDVKTTLLDSGSAGCFLQQKLFSPGNRMSWSELIRHVTGAPLSPDAWIREFGIYTQTN